MNNKHNIKTSVVGNGEMPGERYECAIFTEIPAVDINKIKFEPNFKPYLTFAFHKGSIPSNVDWSLRNQIEKLRENDYDLAFNYNDNNLNKIISRANSIFYDQLCPKNENGERKANPFFKKNGERAIIPVSFSKSLIDLLTNKIGKGGPARFKIIRYEDLNSNYLGIGIKELYQEYLRGIGVREDPLIMKELESVTRKCQFEIGVPEYNTSAIAILNPDPVFPNYPIIKFSKNKPRGLEAINAVKTEEYLIKQEDIKEIGDKVVVGFGNFNGPTHIFNPRRRLLMYLTPEELVPKL